MSLTLAWKLSRCCVCVSIFSLRLLSWDSFSCSTCSCWARWRSFSSCSCSTDDFRPCTSAQTRPRSSVGLNHSLKTLFVFFSLVFLLQRTHACVCVRVRTILECCNAVVSLLEELGGFIQLLLWRLQWRVQLLHLTVSKKTDTVKMLLWLYVTRVLLQVITDTADAEASLWSHKRTCVCNLSLCCCVLSRALATSVLSMSCLTSSSWWKTAQKLQIANQLTCILLLAVKKYLNV